MNKAEISKLANRIAGLLLAIAIGTYLYNFSQQTSAVQAICPKYPVGSSIADIEQVAKEYPAAKLRGPTILSTGESVYTVCSEYSLCEISCSLYFKNNEVINAHCSNCGI